MKKNMYEVAEHLFEIAFAETVYDAHYLSSYEPFRVEKADRPLLFSCRVDEASPVPESKGEEIGQFDCGGCNHGVYLLPDGGYTFVISNVKGQICACLQSNSDFTDTHVALEDGTAVDRSFGLNNAIMIAYAFAAARHQTLLIHSSVIRNQGKGYLFLGKSGTGKSTHTRLWSRYIPGSDLMNDDNPVVRYKDGATWVYGSPWSGKTPCYRNVSAPVGAFVQLEQKKENVIRRESVLQSLAYLLSSVSVMKWDREVYNMICGTISDILSVTPVYHLGCLPDEEAALLSYKTVTSAE